MKQAVRTSILILALVGTYAAAAIPQVPAPDGGPILTCAPGQKQCQGGSLPPA